MWPPEAVHTLGLRSRDRRRGLDAMPDCARRAPRARGAHDRRSGINWVALMPTVGASGRLAMVGADRQEGGHGPVMDAQPERRQSQNRLADDGLQDQLLLRVFTLADHAATPP